MLFKLSQTVRGEVAKMCLLSIFLLDPFSTLLEDTHSVASEQEMETAASSRWMSYQNAAGQQAKRMSMATHAMHLMSADSSKEINPPSYDNPDRPPSSGSVSKRNSWLNKDL